MISVVSQADIGMLVGYWCINFVVTLQLVKRNILDSISKIFAFLRWYLREKKILKQHTRNLGVLVNMFGLQSLWVSLSSSSSWIRWMYLQAPVNWSIERCLTTFLFKNTNLIPHFLTAYFFPRYQEIVSMMTPVSKSSGYNVEEGKWILISFSIPFLPFSFWNFFGKLAFTLCWLLNANTLTGTSDLWSV